MRAIERAKESMLLGGPAPPWTLVPPRIISVPDGEQFWTQNGHGGVNPWTLQRICDAINLLPELVAEIERLTTELSDAHQIIKDDVSTQEALRLHMALVLIATGAYRGDVQDFARAALSPLNAAVLP